MSISELCIKRPVFAQVLSLVILVLGIIFFFKLQIRGTPDIDFPIISINATYTGADAEFMESAVTMPIEKAIRNVKLIDKVTSSSSPGATRVTATFKLGADIEVALNDIRSKISEINSFPKDMDMPQAEKMDADANPTLWVSVSSANYNEMELTEIVTEFIQKPLEKLDSVGSAMIVGSKKYTIYIEPIPKKLLAFNISPLEIEQAVRAQNQDYPAGTIKTNIRDFYLSLKSTKKNVEEFKEIILKQTNNEIIRIGDVANVTLAPEDNDQEIRFNSKSAIAIGLIKQSNSNILDLSSGVRKELEEIRKNLPKGLDINIAYDGALPVKASVESVFRTILEAILLVSIVIYLFLASFKVSIIPLVTIPISLVGTLTFMYLCGFSINTFTLLAMILAIGLVVDDAIVMLENIYRHVEEEKLTPFEAALKGSKEIQFAVIAMTITLASVFLPIGFIDGFVGKLFIEFAWTLAFSVLVSGFVALTLTPMMSSKMIGVNHQRKFKFLEIFDSFINYINKLYILCLEFVFNNKFKFLVLCLAQIVLMVFCFKIVKKEFTPDEDYGILQAIFNGPEGSSKNHTDKFVKDAEQIFKKIEEVQGYFTITGFAGGDSAFGFISLKPWHEREKSQFAVKDEINAKFRDLTGVTAFAMGPRSMIGNGGGKPVEFRLTSSQNLQNLNIIANKFVEQMRANPAFADIEMDIKASTPTVDIAINRDKAYLLGVSVDSIGNTVQYLQSGIKIGDYRYGNEVYNVILQYEKDNRSSIADLSKLYIKNNNGQMIFFDNIAEVQEKITIKAINHYNSLSAIKITSNLVNITGQQAVNHINEIASKLLDVKNTKLEYEGELKQLAESNYQIMLTFLFALIFIYLVLSAQFESFKDPLLILIAVPFSITGGVALIYITGNSLNIYSQIGLVTLIGLVTKNSIMIVEFANQLKEQAYSTRNAILTSAKLRLRPILMTTTATICGAVPLIFATGADSNARHSIGYVIIGGMFIGTLFTLFVIPLLYNIFKKDSNQALTEEENPA
jgi:HAE1 family hydrophobic/amphiphilic exporter-1